MNQKLRDYWPDHHRYQLEVIEREGWVTVGDVLNRVVTEAEILRTPRVGRETLRVVRHVVAKVVLDWASQ
ncbi:MAG: hypothetical protein WCK46_01090 [Candidatus Adlerbacteria bacterium]